MNLHKLHTTLGLILIVPLLAWILTGLVFLIKPGYSDAYAQLTPKLYGIKQQEINLPQQPLEEIRLLRTILGHHLLVKEDNAWQHLDPTTFTLKPLPSEADQIRLLSDAINHHPRYGQIEKRIDDSFITSTGVKIKLHWQTLSIQQTGRDTQFINLLYKIHYLQWLGHKQANILLAVVVLFLLSLLMLYGLLLFIHKAK